MNITASMYQALDLICRGRWSSGSSSLLLKQLKRRKLVQGAPHGDLKLTDTGARALARKIIQSQKQGKVIGA